MYLFLVLYGSTTFQSRSFLKNIENFLCKKKLVNIRSIPSTHAEWKNTVCSHKHSFTPYPSLSSYRWTQWRMEKQIHSLRVGWRNLFSSCAVCCIRFWFWREIGFGLHTHVLRVQYSCGVVLVFWLRWEIVLVLHTYLVYNTVVLLCQFFGCSGK